jgi:hypothetical protein
MGIVIGYLIQGLIVDFGHKRIYGKRTFLSYIPFTSEYIYGKCANGKICGILMAVLSVLGSGYEETLTNGKKAITYYFGSLGQMCSLILGFLSLFCFVLFIYRVITKKKPKDNCNDIPVSPNMVSQNQMQPNMLSNEIPVVDVSKNCDCGHHLNDADIFCPQCGKKKEQ